MSAWSDFRARIDALLHRARADRELDEELRFHVDMSAARYQESGYSSSDAHRLARASLGGTAQTREAVRDARGVQLLDDLAADLRYAARQLRRSPGFTIVAVATLALGIGVNTAIFGVIDGVLLRPVPFRDPSSIVMVWETDRQSGTTREPSSWPDYEDFVNRARSFSAMAALTTGEVNLTASGAEPRRLSVVAATQGYFGLLGLRPLLGRVPSPEEDRPGGPKVVVLGESLWRSAFAADRGVVGKTIQLDDQPYQVIGVMPRGADFALDQIMARAAYHAPYRTAGDIDVWTPAQASAQTTPRQTHPFLVVGRLAPGATIDGAQNEMTSIASDLERTYAQSNTARGVHVESMNAIVFGAVRPLILLLLGAVVLVLLVACVNVASLLLARAAARAREVAVRGALGASLGRLMRQFAVESVLLTLIGGAVGALCAWAGLHALIAFAPADIPRMSDVAINGRVLAATMAVSMAVGVVFGFVPMSQVFKLDVGAAIQRDGNASGGRTRRRFRQGLVVTELAMSVMLVVCAGLLVRSLWSVLRVDPGFMAQGVLKAQYQLPVSRYPNDYKVWPKWAATHRFNDALLGRVRALPGVTSAAIAVSHPLDAGFTNSFTVTGREAESHDWPEIRVRLVTPGYFATLGVAVHEGRVFDATDVADAPFVAVINEAARKRFFPDGAIGQEIRWWGVKRRIVGVVADERIQGIVEDAPPAVYAAIAQAPSANGVLLVRTSGDPVALESAVRSAIHTVDPQLAVYGVEPLSVTLLDSIGQRRFATVLLGAFAAATLLLALIGVHGVLTYTTAQRSRELGIRVALGATRGEVLGLVLRGGVGLAVTGVALGTIGAWAGASYLGTLLFGVTRNDPLTYLVVSVLVVAAAVAATWFPARRAARVQPVEALKS